MVTCRTCTCLEQHNTGLYCPVLDKQIWVINLDLEDIACSAEKRKRALQRHSIKRSQKYPRLESVFAALGYVFSQRKQYEQWKNKTTKANLTINKHPDGAYKTKNELMSELKELRDNRARMCHPDVNNDSESTYCNIEMSKVNEAYKRGVEIINRRYR